ncbi:MAG: ferrous iron transporter B [Prolixibacteraceae bacterium]|nr:ferrous iron transporter B [Prolixibacteraceae bacterium]
MKILLVGNPNVGKSVLFNRLTGMDVISSNYPGTTVDYTKGYLNIQEERIELIDVPGIYSLGATSKAEEIAIQMLKDGNVFLNVIDATNLERGLNLTLQLIKQGKPLLIALNLFDETKHKGITIDVDKLEQTLGVPCIPISALSGEGIKKLVLKIHEARVSNFVFDNSQRWNEIGKIISDVQKIISKNHTFSEKLRDASIKPLTGIPLLVLVLLLTFTLIRFIGEGLIGFVFEPFFEKAWSPLMLGLSELLGQSGLLHDLLIGKLIDGTIDYGQSFGLLTTGLFVPIGAVLPYVFAFYTVLAVLEDSGYLPRVAVMMDNIMHRIGLHGLAIVPMLLGFGCNVPGALATRVMETRKEKFITATLMSIAIPCMALQAMLFGILGPYGFKGLGIVFGTLVIVWFIVGFILKNTIKGTSPEIFLEIPPYRIPYFKGLVKKVWMRLKWFIKEAVPFVLLGIFIANLLYSTGIMQFIGRITSPVFDHMLGLPDEAAGALIMGFLRKDLAVGMLVPLNMTFQQLVVASVVLSMYFPCVATFAVLLKELGIRDMIKSTIVMILSALIAGSLVNLLLSLIMN